MTPKSNGAFSFLKHTGGGFMGKFLINRGGNLSATYSKPYIVEYHISRIGRSLIRSAMSTIRGISMRHVVTQNFNKQNPCEELYNDIPELKPGSCLVPVLLVHLPFDFNISNSKSCSTIILADCLRATCDQACR